jgi:hypothetical protein
MFVRWFWLAVIGLGAGGFYLFQEARVAVYSRTPVTIRADDIARYVLTADRFVRVGETLRMQTYFVSQEHGSEVYYGVFQSPSGFVVTKSQYPPTRAMDGIDGMLEPLSAPVRRAVAKAFPSAPTVSLNVVRRPTPLWLSGLGLVACAGLLVGVLLTGLGFNGFRGAPLGADASDLARGALQSLEKDHYWSARWASPKLGDVAAAVVPQDEAIKVITVLQSEWKVGELEFEAGESRYEENIRYQDILAIRYGTLPVWTKRLPALELRHRRKTVLYAERPDVLVGIFAVVGSLRGQAKKEKRADT